jgi:uncharacterized protein YjiS (DUF1127 family)
MRELRQMSYLELRDIGLTGFDVQHLAWGGSAPGRPWQDMPESAATVTCEACNVDEHDTRCVEGDDTRSVEGVAHLDLHLLKDIGAPHWLVTRAAERHGAEHLRWLGLEHR